MDSTAGPAVAYPVTAAEAAAGVIPTNTTIPSHVQAGGCYLERYGGAIGAASAANDAAFAKALLHIFNSGCENAAFDFHSTSRTLSE